jgi:hypothetical protein
MMHCVSDSRLRLSPFATIDETLYYTQALNDPDYLQ